MWSSFSHLFRNFLVAFSRAFGCTNPFAPLPGGSGPVQLAYAHKFMNLEYNQLGYFIKQLTLAARHYGFSVQDSDTLSTRMNSQYNVRCAPAISFSPASPAQLLSLCQNPTCPLAVPVSDCAAYNNLTATGVASSNPTTVTSTATATVLGGPADSTNPNPPSSGSSDKLSAGGIAGVAIGGAAVLVIAVIAAVFFLKRRHKTPPPTPSVAPVGWDQSRFSSPGLIDPNSPYTPKDSHMSYYSTGHPPSAMDSRLSGIAMTPQMNAEQQWTPPAEMWSPPIVEMESTPATTHQPTTYQQQLTHFDDGGQNRQVGS
jgi:hypothetical protein